MNIEKWIAENSSELVDFDTCHVGGFISNDKLRELIKTHAIVPRKIEPYRSTCTAMAGVRVMRSNERDEFRKVAAIYAIMVKEIESDEQ